MKGDRLQFFWVGLLIGMPLGAFVFFLGQAMA